jgi:hypothetical protein
MGNYFRGQTEHVLFAVRGSLGLLRKDASTLLPAWKRGGRHSEKPDQFFEFVSSCSPGHDKQMEANMNEGENPSVEQKIEKIRARRLAACPRSSKRLLASSSPRAAIKAFCTECVGYDRLAATGCTAYACPLWRYRPFQTKEDRRS